jgi:hypothetical protein
LSFSFLYIYFCRATPLEKAHKSIIEDKAATKIQATFKGYYLPLPPLPLSLFILLHLSLFFSPSISLPLPCLTLYLKYLFFSHTARKDFESVKKTIVIQTAALAYLARKHFSQVFFFLFSEKKEG